MRKNVIPLVLIAVCLTLTVVSASTIYDNSIVKNMTNPISQIKYELDHGFFLFTSAGQAAGCSIYPDWQGWIRGSATSPSSLPNSISCSKVSGVFSGSDKCAIDSWYDNTIYLNGANNPPSSVNWNNYNGERLGTGISFSSSAFPYWYVQIYACPSSSPSQTNPNTKVYTCNANTGGWLYQGTYTQNQYCSYSGSGNGNLCWCSSSSDNFYIDQNGGVHCRPSSYSSVTDGSWCSVPSQPTVPQNPQPSNPATSCNIGDSDNSGDISMTELGVYIQGWIGGTISRDDLSKVIMEFTNGCG